eukprot:6173276-Pleurochrysis_carterae.AAC.2
MATKRVELACILKWKTPNFDQIRKREASGLFPSKKSSLERGGNEESVPVLRIKPSAECSNLIHIVLKSIMSSFPISVIHRGPRGLVRTRSGDAAGDSFAHA